MQSKYLGVYNNNYFPTKDKYPYRIAVKRFIDDRREYLNFGHAKTEEAAAYIYNVYALTTFGRGAVLNDVEFTPEVELEVEYYSERTPGFKELVEQSLEVLSKHGTEIKVNDAQDRVQSEGNR